MKQLIYRLLPGLPLFVGCATLTRLGGAAGGGALGSIAGPGGAAVGAAGGLLLAETTVPVVPVNHPETVWGLLGKLIDQAAWFGAVIAILWLLTWIAPSPKELFKRAVTRWRARPTGDGTSGP